MRVAQLNVTSYLHTYTLTDTGICKLICRDSQKHRYLNAHQNLNKREQKMNKQTDKTQMENERRECQIIFYILLAYLVIIVFIEFI